ncbi:(2Fe-2S)-binding protein [Anaeroselena agilis]|uniref:(2Fe-2S)-binding protein n=1 Tax=Anaeroselena agilis TaxID=3063788 RepID=A0ABU3P189_9FIRM|nr:(2Fe-2S)-binding protein [Selenomonadales bacterium 4137-cl]
MSKHICRCEEVTEDEIRQAIAEGATTVNGVKRRTGAGMGLCQGRTCRRLIAGLIAAETGQNPGEIEPSSVRPPVRSVTVEALLNTDGGPAVCKCREEDK